MSGWSEGHLEVEVRSAWERRGVGVCHQMALKLVDSNKSLQKLQSSGYFWYTVWKRKDKKLWAVCEGINCRCCSLSLLPWIQLYNSWSRVQVSLDFHKWFLWVLEQEIIVLMSWGIAGAQNWECDREAIIYNDKAISLQCRVFLRTITTCRCNARGLRNMNLWEF